MPHLDPAPWFNILVASWLVFLAVLPLKIMTHTFPNEPSLQNAKPLKTDNWNWPWA